MKKCFFIGALLLLNICYSQSKFSIGASSGFTTIKKTYGINENFFVGYNTSKNITLGVDAFFNQMKDDGVSINTTVLMPYIEGGVPEKGMIKDKFYFSGILGSGYMEQKNTIETRNAITVFAGTKVNYKLSEKVIVGLKSGYYFSKFDGVIMANLFLAYKL